jgi:hypothetical protein
MRQNWAALAARQHKFRLCDLATASENLVNGGLMPFDSLILQSARYVASLAANLYGR